MKVCRTPVQGTVRRNVVSLKLGFADEDYGYAIDLGLLVAGASAFNLDPEIKTETIWVGEFYEAKQCARLSPWTERPDNGRSR